MSIYAEICAVSMFPMEKDDVMLTWGPRYVYGLYNPVFNGMQSMEKMGIVCPTVIT